MSCCGKKNEALTCGVYNALRSLDDGRNIGNALMLANDEKAAPPNNADMLTKNTQNNE